MNRPIVSAIDLPELPYLCAVGQRSAAVPHIKLELVKVLGVLLILGTGNLIFAGLAYWGYKKYSSQQALLAEQRAAAGPNL